MGEVIELFDRKRYCLDKRCWKVDCEKHCRSCAQDILEDLEVHLCPACAASDFDDSDLYGFWDPEQAPPSPLARRRQNTVVEEALRRIGDLWFSDGDF